MDIDNNKISFFQKMINNILRKKYYWFDRIDVKDIKFINKHGGVSVNRAIIIADIFVDGNWGYKQWRKYNHSQPLPGDDEELSFIEIIGNEIIDDLEEIFSFIIRHIFRLKISVFSFSSIDTYFLDLDNNDLQEQIRDIIREETNEKNVLTNYIHKNGIFNFLIKSRMTPALLERIINFRELPKELIYEFMDDVANKSLNDWLLNYFEVPIKLDKGSFVYEIQRFGYGGVEGEGYNKFGEHVKDSRIPYNELSDEHLYQLFDMVLYGPYYFDIYGGEPI